MGGISDFSELILPPGGRGKQAGTDYATIDRMRFQAGDFKSEKWATSAQSPLASG